MWAREGEGHLKHNVHRANDAVLSHILGFVDDTGDILVSSEETDTEDIHWSYRPRNNTRRDDKCFLHFNQPQEKSINKITCIYIYIYISKVHYGTKI